jgi:hypothetical protein
MKYKGARISLYHKPYGWINNLQYGFTIAEPNGYRLGWTKQEAIDNAKTRIDEIIINNIGGGYNMGCYNNT